MSINKYYKNCIKRKATNTINEYGKYIKSYEDYQIKGYIGSQQNIDFIVSNKIVIRTIHNFYCNDFDVNQDDLIVYNNETYEVYSDNKDTATRGHHNKLKLRKLEGVKGG